MLIKIWIFLYFFVHLPTERDNDIINHSNYQNQRRRTLQEIYIKTKNRLKNQNEQSKL
jgi:hypothetical protein